MSSSNDYMVVLQRVEVDMTGRYTCEVSTEDHFETVREEAEMEVIGGKNNKFPQKKCCSKILFFLRQSRQI